MEKNAPLTGLVTSAREPAAGRKPTLRTGRTANCQCREEPGSAVLTSSSCAFERSNCALNNGSALRTIGNIDNAHLVLITVDGFSNQPGDTIHNPMEQGL